MEYTVSCMQAAFVARLSRLRDARSDSNSTATCARLLDTTAAAARDAAIGLTIGGNGDTAAAGGSGAMGRAAAAPPERTRDPTVRTTHSAHALGGRLTSVP